MGNLNYPKAILLYNSLSADDIGIYDSSTEAGDGHIHLFFMDKGIDIPGCNIEGNTAGITQFNATRCNVACTDAGELRIVCLLLNIQCPCEECNFEWGLTINHIEKNTSPITNYFAPPSKFYGDRISRVECTDGYINDEYLILMENSIIDQIGKDEHAYVSAIRRYVLTGYSDGDGLNIGIILPDGTVVTLTGISDASGSCETLADEINTYFETEEIDDLTAIGNDTDDTLTIYGTNGYVFTLTDDGDSFESVDRYLCISQIYSDVTFTVEYSPGSAEQTVITEGRFPSLTGYDVFRVFAAAGHHGSLSQIVTKDQPDVTAEYCLFSFRTTRTHKYDLVGASHLNDYYQYVDVYIKKDYVGNLYWLSSELSADTEGIYTFGDASADVPFYDEDGLVDDIYNYFCHCDTGREQ